MKTKALKISTVLFLALTVQACANHSSVRQSNSGHDRNISSVAVVSALTKKLSVYYVGTTAFNNKIRYIDVTAWDINNTAAQIFTEQLRPTTGATVNLVNAGDDEDALSNVANSMNTVIWKIPKQKTFIKEFVAKLNTDLVIVLNNPGYGGDVFFDTSVPVEGYGIYRRSAFGNSTSINYLTIEAIAYDGHTGEELGYAVEELSHPRREEGSPEETLEVTAQELSELRSNIQAMLRQASGNMVKKLGI